MRYKIFDDAGMEQPNLLVTQDGVVVRKDMSPVDFVTDVRLSTGLEDADGKIIYVDDVLQSDTGLMGTVSYNPKHAAYILLDYENGKWYELGQDICLQLHNLGNYETVYGKEGESI